MKPTAGHALRLAACLCGFVVAALAGVPAHAQSSAAAAGPPAPAATAYEDRLIGGGSLTPDISAGDNSTSDTTGLARSIRIDAVASVLHQDGPGSAPDTHEDGILANAQWDTVSYGAWSANLAARLNGNDERTSLGGGSGNTAFSIQERAMPFDDGWQTDNGLGDLSAPLINLARMQSRFVLSQGTMLGATTEWRGPDGLQIVAGGGEPGVFDGIKIPTFQTIGGSTYTLGAQWSPAPQWSVGGEFVSANDVSLYYQPLDSSLFPGAPNSPRISTDTGLVSAAWQGSGMHAQLNLIDGTVGDNANAFGAWADATMTRGSVTQAFGAFRIDPNLAWGNQLITNDVQGGYYRADYQSRRLTAGVGIDEVTSVSGNGSDTTFLNADARYQLSRDTGVGGVVNVRRGSDETAWSLEGYLDHANDWGLGRAQLDYATDTQTDDATVTLQQSWKTPLGVRLATTVAVDRIRDTPVPGAASQDSTLVRLAVNGGGDLTARLSLDGSVQWAQAVQGNAAPSTTADLTLSWEINRAWSVLGSYYENRIGSWTQLVISSPLTPATPTPVPSMGASGFFLTVRYQDSRGSHFAPLGGVMGSGSGRLTGVVYLDANENGRFDAGESGAANVTVVLDGRYSARTDSNGRYDFPAVASGHHVITVQGDNLPLPWALANSGRTDVDVSTRERTEIDIGAQRIK